MTIDIQSELSKSAIRLTLVLILFTVYEWFGFEDFIAMMVIAAFIHAMEIDEYLVGGAQ